MIQGVAVRFTALRSPSTNAYWAVLLSKRCSVEMTITWTNNGIDYELPDMRMFQVAMNWVRKQKNMKPKFKKATPVEKRRLEQIMGILD